MSDKQPNVVAQITITLFEDGSIDIYSDAELLTRIHMLKNALDHDMYNAAILLAKDDKGIPVS